MRVKDVQASPVGAVIVFEDPDEDRFLHMVVGPSEGQTIFLRHERRAFERPLTHDLFDQIIGFAQTDVVEVRVDDVRGGIYVARVTVENRRKKKHTLDARASDSIAIALGRGLPIWFADHVVDQMAVSTEVLADDEDDVDDPHDAL